MKKREDRLGSRVVIDDTGIPRLDGGTYAVTAGTSCSDCAFHGLGHRVCPHIRCTSPERIDGTNVVYRKVKDEQDGS